MKWNSVVSGEASPLTAAQVVRQGVTETLTEIVHGALIGDPMVDLMMIVGLHRQGLQTTINHLGQTRLIIGQLLKNLWLPLILVALIATVPGVVVVVGVVEEGEVCLGLMKWIIGQLGRSQRQLLLDLHLLVQVFVIQGLSLTVGVGPAAVVVVVELEVPKNVLVWFWILQGRM
jgi:hypothetical protein